MSEFDSGDGRDQDQDNAHHAGPQGGDEGLAGESSLFDEDEMSLFDVPEDDSSFSKGQSSTGGLSGRRGTLPGRGANRPNVRDNSMLNRGRGAGSARGARPIPPRRGGPSRELPRAGREMSGAFNRPRRELFGRDSRTAGRIPTPPRRPEGLPNPPVEAIESVELATNDIIEVGEEIDEAAEMAVAAEASGVHEENSDLGLGWEDDEMAALFSDEEEANLFAPPEDEGGEDLAVPEPEGVEQASQDVAFVDAEEMDALFDAPAASPEGFEAMESEPVALSESILAESWDEVEPSAAVAASELAEDEAAEDGAEAAEIALEDRFAEAEAIEEAPAEPLEPVAAEEAEPVVDAAGAVEPVEAEAAEEVVEAAEADEAGAEKGPKRHVPQAPPTELAGERYLQDHTIYRQESRRLARSRRWKPLVEMMSNASRYAEWASLPEVRAALLAELGRLYADQLKDPAKAEETFKTLASEEPTNREALAFLEEMYRSQNKLEAVHDLYVAAANSTWDPSERVSYTKEAVAIAAEELRDVSLEVADWQNLWQLGEQSNDTAIALASAYRRKGAWRELIAFMADLAKELEGPRRRVLTREIIEISLSALREPEQAAPYLKEIREERPEDPIALRSQVRLAFQTRDLDLLASLSRLEGLPDDLTHDTHRVAADALWQLGERELAVSVYESLLQRNPEDRDALKAKETYLEESGNYGALCAFLETRAQREVNAEGQPSTSDRIALLERAARIADEKLGELDRAIALWHQRIELGGSVAEAYKISSELYERLGNQNGVASSLEGLLEHVHRPSERIELYARLGAIYTELLDDDLNGEERWRAVLMIDPNHLRAQRELATIYKRRGDYESLSRALAKRIASSEGEALLDLTREAAENIEENIDNPQRSIAAWERMLDLSPQDETALRSLALRFEDLDRHGEQIACVEERARCSTEEAQRLELSVQAAQLWEGYGEHLAARSIFERCLRWSPTEAQALAVLDANCQDDEHGLVRALFERAATLEEGEDARRGAMRTALKHLPEEDHLRRFDLLRRLVHLNDTTALDELRELAKKHARLVEFEGELRNLVLVASDETERADALAKLALLQEEDLEDSLGAFISRMAVGFEASRFEEGLEDLARLGRENKRWSELLAIYQGLASERFPVATRQRALLEAIAIYKEQLEDPERALESYRVLLGLEPGDFDLLAQAEALAKEHSLLDQLYGIYGMLWDAAEDDETRASVLQKRHALVAEIGDHSAALHELILRHRVQPSDELKAELIALAETQEDWRLLLPMLAGAVSAAEEVDQDALVEVAKLYEEKLEAQKLAFELYVRVLLVNPEHESAIDELERLAEKTGDKARLAQSLRWVAARCQAPERSLVLYQRLGELYAEQERPNATLDIHRQILRLAPEDKTSLDALIDSHRKHQEWSELRDRLQQRLKVTPEEEQSALWLEVARISGAELNDPEAALEALARILSIEPEHEEARKEVATLTDDSMGPEVVARRIRLEMNLAGPEERPTHLLRLAEVQADALKTPEDACVTLRTLIEETGPMGPGFEPLSKELRNLELWGELIELYEARAAEAEEDERRECLEEALRVADEHGASDEVIERLLIGLQGLAHEEDEIFTRLARAYRKSERWDELLAILEKATELESDPEEKARYILERARVMDLALDRSEDAVGLYLELGKMAEATSASQLALASLAKRNDNVDDYISYRERHAKELEPKSAALVYCHLAEVADEHGINNRVAGFYRRARALHKENTVAAEALRALGRRLRNWRAVAALLPEDGEEKLSWAERSERLVKRAIEDSGDALEWLQRALATNPDNIAAWKELARVHRTGAKYEEEVVAFKGAFDAFLRCVKPSVDSLITRAELLHELADACRRASFDAEATYWDEAAYAIAPSFAPAALAVAHAFEEAGELERALALYNEILKGRADLDDDLAGHALFKRGALAAKLGRRNEAIDDLRATVRAQPLHLNALTTLASIHLEAGETALALSHLQQALVVAEEVRLRGDLFHKVGDLWQDGFEDPVEAGPYFEQALDHGCADPNLMKRALDHYRRDGRTDEALTIVDELTETTTEPKALATLWTTRGEILESSAPDEATEAYDMALSYEPGSPAALDGLERMLVAREEWAQLAELLEGRIDASESKDDQVASLRRLADLQENKLYLVEETNDTLRRLLELEEDADVVERLLNNLDGAPIDERRELLEMAIQSGKNRFDRALELATYHLEQGRRQQAWALLSPLRVIIHLESELKDTVNDLRKEFERSEPTEIYEQAQSIMPLFAPLHDALLEALELAREALSPMLRSDLEDISNPLEVSETTPNGKLFATFRDVFGVAKVQLQRAIDLPEAILYVDSEPPAVCLKTEIFQKASGGELHFWLADALMRGREGLRVLAALPEEKRAGFPRAFLTALGLAELAPEDQALVNELQQLLDEELRQELREIVEITLEEADPGEALSLWDEVVAYGELAGAFMVADMRAVWRAMSRKYEDIPEQRNVKTVEDLNALFDGSRAMSRILRFYASEAFEGCFS